MAMGAPTQETYGDDFRATALTLVEAAGGKGSVRRVATSLGMPVSTLHHWFATSQKQNETPAFTTIRENKRDELAKALYALAVTAIEVLNDEEKLKAAPLHDVALVVGMAIDKMLLLMGDAPANTEHTERGIYTNLRYEPDVQDAEYEEEDDGDIVEESEPSP